MYDEFGRLFNYYETSEENGSATVQVWVTDVNDKDGDGDTSELILDDIQVGVNAKTLLHKDNMYYNPFGQLIAYDEAVTDSQGRTTLRHVDNIRYNENNLLAMYRETQDSELTSCGIKITTITDRTSIKYNPLNQMASYMDSVTTITPNSIDTNLVDSISLQYTTWEGATYNNKGQLTGYKETTKQIWFVTDGTLGSYEAKRDYNTLISYDNQTDAVTSDPRILRFYSGYPLPDTKVELTRSNMSYNGLGQLQAYDELTKNLMAEEEQGISTIKHVTNMYYDSTNQLAGFRDITRRYTGLDENNIAEYTRTDGTKVFVDTSTTIYRYGAILGPGDMLSSYEETMTEVGSFTEKDALGNITSSGSIDHSVKTTRENITYDNLLRITSYQDTIIDDASPNLVTTVSFQALNFWSTGRVEEYQETRTEYDSIPTTVQVWEMDPK